MTPAESRRLKRLASTESAHVYFGLRCAASRRKHSCESDREERSEKMATFISPGNEKEVQLEKPRPAEDA